MKENRIRVLKVAPLKIPEVCDLDNDLRALQEAVSIGADYIGLIEVVDLGDEQTCLICNEEGKLIGLPLNRCVGQDIIAGVFYVVGQDEDRNFTSLSDERMAYYKKRFEYREYFISDEIGNMIVWKLR